MRRPTINPVLISVSVRVDPRAIVRLEGTYNLKNPMTSLGIEPATFGLVTIYRIAKRIPGFQTPANSGTKIDMKVLVLVV
jgi:hypothetical protein